MDMYDMKPDAPAEYRGIWQPIRTNVPGFDITELFPQAGQGHRQVLDRPLAAPRHRRPLRRRPPHAHRPRTWASAAPTTRSKFPGIGAIVTRELRPAPAGHARPTSAVPYATSIGLRPGYFGGHFLGAQHNPFETGGDPNAPNFQVQNLNLASGLTLDRLEDRRALLEHFDDVRASARQPPATSRRWTASTQEAFEFVTGPAARKAFDIGKEDPRLRDRYGRHSWGQSTLLARRLVEAGSTFVTVHFGGWDHHWDLKAGIEQLPAAGRRRASRRCSPTWTTAACSTRRWSCCAASSAARRR